MSSSPQFISRPPAEIYGRHLGYGFAGAGVNTAMGNFTQTTVDLAFPGGSLGLLDWARTYNSLSGAVGVLGPGWTTTFSAHLVVSEQGVLHHTTGQVTLYDDDGRVLIFLPAPGGGFTRPQDLFGDLAQAADGSFTITYLSGEAWSFSSAGQLTGRSREGQTVTVDYAADGLLSQARHSSGQQLSFAYDSNRRLTQVASGDGRTVSFGYADDGTLMSVTDPGGGTTNFATVTSGPFPQVSSITDADGHQLVVNTYDSGTQQVKTQAFPAGGADFSYGDTGLTTVTSTPSGGQVTFQADANGRMTRVTDPFGNAATFAFDADGLLSQAVAPGGTELSQTHDAAGNLLTNTFGGATTTLTHDDANRVETVTDAVGGVTRYGYTGDSHVPTTVTAPNGGVFTQVIDNGLISAQTDADGHTTSYGHDAAGNLTSLTDPLGHLVQFSYDAAGNRTGFTAASGATAQWTYDQLGRLLSATDPNGALTSYRYSAAGQLLEIADPSGAVTAFAYTAAGLAASITDALGRVTSFGYDDDGNLITITGPMGEVTKASYDALGRMTSLTDPVGGVTALSYDADGNQISEQTPAGTTKVSYDARGNQVSVAAPDGAMARYTFDAADRLTAATGPDGATWTTTYDAAGNIVANRNPLGAVTSQAWTRAGRLVSATDALGRTTSYARDNAGRVTEVTDAEGGVTRYVYDENGRKISATTPAGLVTRFGYDAAGRLIAVTDPRGWITRTQYNARGDKTETIAPDGPSQAANPYAYANNDPLNAVDPLGTLAFTFTAGGALETFAAAASAPARRVSAMTRMPIGDCPGDPTVATLKQLSRAVQQNNFGLIAGILNVSTSLLFRKPAPPPLQAEVVNTGDSYTCGRFGTGCGNKIVMVPKYNNANTAIPLGAEFWTGFGGRNQYFNQWDPFTQMLMREPWIQETINTLVKPDLQCGVFANSNDYLDPKTHIVGDILGAFTDGRLPGTTDPAVGFLGSYSLDWVAVPTSEKSATVFFTVTNKTDLNSLIHPEFFTFGKVRSVDGARPEFAFLFGPIPGGLFTAIGFRPTTQKIQWQENVGYTYNPAPITP